MKPKISNLSDVQDALLGILINQFDIDADIETVLDFEVYKYRELIVVIEQQFKIDFVDNQFELASNVKQMSLLIYNYLCLKHQGD